MSIQDAPQAEAETARRGVFTKEPDPLDWARGRLVAIRPDGARKSFDADAAVLLRDDRDWQLASEVLPEFYAQERERIELLKEQRAAKP
jgi:hypothetical protein